MLPLNTNHNMNNITQPQSTQSETEALLQISQMLARSMDLPTILRQIVDASILLIPNTDQSVIHLVDESNQLLRPLAVARPSLYQEQTPIFFRYGEGIAGLVIEGGETINVHDTTADARFIPPAKSQIAYRSLLVAPIKLNNQTIGTLSVESKLPNTFLNTHQKLLTQLGEQAALAIDRARVLQEEQEQRALAETLREVSNIQGSSANLELVLNQILRLLSKVVPFDTASVMMIENGQARLRFIVGLNEFENAVGNEFSEFTIDITQYRHFQTLMESGKPVIITDTFAENSWTSELPGARSWIGAPIQAAGKVVAILSLLKGEPNFYQNNHADRLLAFANQASLTIQNAQLFEATQQRLREVNLLFRVSQRLAESLDVNVISQQVITLLQEQFHFYYVQVLLYDLSGEKLILRQSSDLPDPLRSHPQLPDEMSIPRHVVNTRQTFWTNNVNEVPFYIQSSALPFTKAELAVPLRSGNSLLGVLDIHLQDPRQFREHDIQLINAIAEQLILAVEKAILYEDLQSTLAKEQAARAQLVQTEKLAALGQIVASVAHELNNPLQAIQNALYLINLEESLASQARDDLQVALNESNRMAGLIARLRETYRPTTSEEYQPCSMNEIVSEVEKLINTHLQRNNIEFSFVAGKDLPNCVMIQDQIKQVILNICLNAVESMSKGGKLSIKTAHDLENDHLILKITDTGSGIHPDVLPYIFDPFVTTKDRGTGLGLAITHDIIRRHGGVIDPESELGIGTTFTVKLPVNPQQNKLDLGYKPF
jgi:signal transduction histidine kinase